MATPPPVSAGSAGSPGSAGPAQVLLTGEQRDISAGDYRATVTALGAGLRQLSFRGQPVLAGYQAAELPSAGTGQLLLPWPNRVDGGRYSFGGRDYQLDLSEPQHGNAIHGLTRWTGWDIAATTADSVTLRLLLLGRPGYPFCLELTAAYQLNQDAGLRADITARNAGSGPAPYGAGQHPYLTAGAPELDDCTLQLAARDWLPADERGIPTGPPRPVAGTPYDFTVPRPLSGISLDHALTGLARDGAGRARAVLRSGGGHQDGPGGQEERAVELWAGPGFDWLQVFTGDALPPERRRRALAVEPMTCPPNALASGTGLLVLEPGASVTHSWGAAALQS